MDVLAAQLADVQRRCPAADLESASDPSRLLTVPEAHLCYGWSATVTSNASADTGRVAATVFINDAAADVEAAAKPA